jgi:hypothetical protein
MITRRKFLAGAAALGVMPFVGTRASAASMPGVITQNGATYVGPAEKVSPTFDSGVGVIIKADDVTIVNPSIRNYQTAISIRRKDDGRTPKRVRIIYDPSQPAAPAGARLYNCRQGVEVQIAEGVEVGSLVRSQKFKIIDCFRPCQILSGRDIDFHDLRLRHPTVREWNPGAGPKGSIIGCLTLPDINKGALDDGTYRFENIRYRYNNVADVWEEGLSFDCRGNEPTNMQTRDADVVASVKATSDTVTLNSANWALSGVNYKGFYMAFVAHSQSGKPMRIISRSGATFTLDTSFYPDVLAGVGAGARAVIIAPFLNCTVEGNLVNGVNSRAPIVLHGGSYGARILNNEATASTRFQYGSEMPNGPGLRPSTLRPGQYVYQAARISSLSAVTRSGAVANTNPPAPSEYNRMEGNTFHNGDASFHCVRYGGTVYTSRNYNGAGLNTFDDTSGDGAQLWNNQQTLI